VSRVRQILLIGHTHHDVGYTNSPRIVDRMHARIVGEVLRLSDEGPTTGSDAFRWTFEVARPVLSFLASVTPGQRSHLRRLVKAGRVSVTGGYLNMTQLPGAAEFDAAYDQLALLRAAGIPVRTEQHGDVNGIAWGTVPAMRRAGIERLVMALNPDHGRPPFEQPTGFWWEGPDGGRVFVWLSTHYGFGEEWGIIDADTAMAERNIAAFLERLDQREDYPYDTALVHAANDNRWPNALFLDVVRHWNSVHPETPMRTATIDDALDVLVAQAREAEGRGDRIPVVHGEWSDWWSHGHGSTAREVAVYRQARSLELTAAATLGLTALRGDGAPALASVLGYRRGPVRLRTPQEILTDLAEVDEQLLLFGEHTWGSWETYSKPRSTFSYSHWNAKAAFAYASYDFARDLAVEGLFRLVASGAEIDGTDLATGAAGGAVAERAIAVVNATETARSEPVTVEVDGAELLTLVARDVPAFGTAILPIPSSPVLRGTGTQVETSRYRAVVDSGRGGVVSLIDEATGLQLVDRDDEFAFGAVVVERIAPGSQHPMVTADPKRFRPEDPGPDFVRHAASGTEPPTIVEAGDHVAIAWRSSTETIPVIDSTLRLYHGLGTIDLEVAIVKPEDFDPESVFVTFPFALSRPQFLVETAGAVYLAETEQLPDTSKDWYSIQHAIGIRGNEGAVLWGSYDAPLVQLGGYHTGEWARTLRAQRGHVNSWLMNNLHFTNFQARQDGSATYRYRFEPVVGGGLTGTVDHEQVRRYGRDLLQPLQARQYAGPVRLDGGSGLRVEPAEDVLAELRPVDGGVRLRLRNIGRQERRVTVSWSGGEHRAGGAAPVETVLSIPSHGVGETVLPL